jgi:alkylation response protein AidB-like acyl-CoA dehydrogenase
MSTSEQSAGDAAQRIQYAFTDEQEQFRSALRRFLDDKSPPTEVRRLMETAEGYNPEVWRQLSDDLGLPGIHVPQAYGGAGFGMVELGIVMEELGRSLFCGPYFSSAVLAANAILNAGTPAQKESLLPDIAGGARLATLALTEPNGEWDPRAIQLRAAAAGNGYTLNGVKSYVVDGHIADLLIVAARVDANTGGDAVALFTLAANAGGVTRRLLKSMDPTRKIAQIDFKGVRADLLGTLDDGAQALARTLDQAAVALANEMVGGAQKLLESAVNYAKMRVQFGREIGSLGDQTQAGRHAAGRRTGQVHRLLRGTGCRGRGSGVARNRLHGESRGVRRVHAHRHRNDPDSWRHRIHLGQRHASVVQARQKLGGVPGPAELPSRTADAALEGLSNE